MLIFHRYQKKASSCFQVCREHGFKLNPEKCQLVTDEVQFFGRIMNKKRVRCYRRHYEALINMSAPTTVGALMELVHGANWMKTAIPNFSVLIFPLHDLLGTNCTSHKTGKKTRLIIRPITAWGTSIRMHFKASLL